MDKLAGPLSTGWEWFLAFLREAVWLWLVTAAIVAVASIVHYWISSSELKALKDELRRRGSRHRSRSADEGSTELKGT